MPESPSTVGRLNRRHLLALGGATLAAATTTALPPANASPESTGGESSIGFHCYTDLLAHIRQRGHKLRVLGHCPDGSPMVAVKVGGKKKPAIFISAGKRKGETYWWPSSQATSSTLMRDGAILTAFGTGYRIKAGKNSPQAPRDVGLIEWRLNTKPVNAASTIRDAAFDSNLRNVFDPQE